RIFFLLLFFHPVEPRVQIGSGERAGDDGELSAPAELSGEDVHDVTAERFILHLADEPVASILLGVGVPGEHGDAIMARPAQYGREGIAVIARDREYGWMAGQQSGDNVYLQ